MVHGKSRDIETVFETCLIKYSPIRGKELLERLRKRGLKLSRSQFYRYAARVKKSGKLKRVNGIYHYQKPQNQKAVEGKTEKSLSGEISIDEARSKAMAMLERFAMIAGYTYSKEELDYVLNENDGKRMLEKAEALLKLRRTKALS